MPKGISKAQFRLRKIAEFLDESNRIEGIDYEPKLFHEALVYPEGIGILHIDNSVRAFHLVEDFCKEPMTIDRVLQVHAAQMKDVLPSAGSFRTKQVYVGAHTPPKAEVVPMLMDQWVQDFNDSDVETVTFLGTKNIKSALDLHYAFEHIHPFIDGNGRVGRLLWAWDQLRHDRNVIPLLDVYAPLVGNNFYDKRREYYRQLQNYHEKR